MKGKPLLPEIERYWHSRAQGYSQVNQEELAGCQRKNWSCFLDSEICRSFSKSDEESLSLEEKSGIKILDVGTGPGFFPIILTELGYDVTACDYTEQMLEKARENAGEAASKIRFLKADAQNLTECGEIYEQSFDVVICRNLLWNLEYPEKAYESFFSVLKNGGMVMVFDANWYSYLFDEKKRVEYEKDRLNVAAAECGDYNIGENFDVMETLALKMPLSRQNRPDWDKAALEKCGFCNVKFALDVGQKLYSEKEKINYKSTPLFFVRGEKG